MQPHALPLLLLLLLLLLHPSPALSRRRLKTRSRCNNFCRRRHSRPRCFRYCARHFPSTATTVIRPTPPPRRTGGAGGAGAFTPSCALSFPAHIGVCLTSEERKLARLVNDYRASHGLHRVPLSPTLCTVAQAHAFDSEANNPVSRRCNLHSWSGSCGTWSAVCYTGNHAQARGMWRKPREFNPGFGGNGYEISVYSGGGGGGMAELALRLWKGSPGHDAVIRERGAWGPFRSMGVGVYGGYAHVWFADVGERRGGMGAC